MEVKKLDQQMFLCYGVLNFKKIIMYKRGIVIVITFFAFVSVKAQNVGIGEPNPTHTLHVSPFVPGDDPIRVSGLNLSNINTDTAFVMFNNNDGVFKYIPFQNVLNSLIDSITSSSSFTSIINNSIDQAKTPSGAVFAFPTSTAPTGYLSCNGQAVSRTTYVDLFSLIGTNYGAGDGSTTFNLPNYNGQFLRGWDNGQGTDLDAANRTDRGDGTIGDAVGTLQTGATLAHNHTIDPPTTTSNSAGDHLHIVDPPVTSSSTTGSHIHNIDPPSTNTNTTGAHTHTHTDVNVEQPFTPTYNVQLGGGATRASNTRTTSSAGAHAHSLNIPAFNSASSGNHTHTTDIASFNSSSAGNHTHSTDIAQFNSGNDGGSETRPTNVSVLWCIKF
jgi:microcystin-dependent protein